MGKDTCRAKCYLLGKELTEFTDEWDLGVIVQDDLKDSQQCTKAVNMANKVLGLIGRRI